MIAFFSFGLFLCVFCCWFFNFSKLDKGTCVGFEKCLKFSGLHPPSAFCLLPTLYKRINGMFEKRAVLKEECCKWLQNL